VPLAAVVTSLGVGGLAFAMAARPTLENLIAGVTLYLDKPVKVGQFCQFDDVLGTVERIGLRSTRIRRWGGNVLSVPNAQFAEYQLDNYNDTKYIWIRQRLRLRYETSADQLKFILAKLREMLFAHPKVLLPRVRLIGFNDDSLTVEILAYTDTGVWAEWHAIREDVFLRVMQIIESSGTRLALPSQTTYFVRDDGLDDEKKRAAEAQVHEWTQKGELPFPDMTEEQQKALAGTLDFPPTGSIEYKDMVESEAGTDKS
jgi:MscS family membrane protein